MNKLLQGQTGTESHSPLDYFGAMLGSSSTATSRRADTKPASAEKAISNRSALKNGSLETAKFKSKKKLFYFYQDHVIIESICRLLWKVTSLTKWVLWILSGPNSRVTQLPHLRRTRMDWVLAHRTALFGLQAHWQPVQHKKIDVKNAKSAGTTHNFNNAKLSSLLLGYPVFLPLSSRVGLLVESWHSCPRCKPTDTSSDIFKWQQTNKPKRFLCQTQQPSSKYTLTFNGGQGDLESGTTVSQTLLLLLFLIPDEKLWNTGKF